MRAFGLGLAALRSPTWLRHAQTNSNRTTAQVDWLSSTDLTLLHDSSPPGSFPSLSPACDRSTEHHLRPSEIPFYIRSAIIRARDLHNTADITPPGAHAQFLHRPHPHRRAHRPPILHRHRPRLAAAPLPVQVAGQRAILHAQLQPLLLVRAGPTTSALALRTPARDSARQAHEPQGAPRDGQLLHRPGLEHAPVRAVRCRAADDLARCAGPGRDEDCAVGAQGGGARFYYWRRGVLVRSV